MVPRTVSNYIILYGTICIIQYCNISTDMILYHNIWYCIMWNDAILYNMIHYDTILYLDTMSYHHTISYSIIILYSTILCHIKYNEAQYYIVLYDTILFCLVVYW